MPKFKKRSGPVGKSGWSGCGNLGRKGPVWLINGCVAPRKFGIWPFLWTRFGGPPRARRLSLRRERGRSCGWAAPPEPAVAKRNPTVVTARVSHKARNPRKNKVAQKQLKSRFRGNSQSRSKSRSESRFASFPLQQNLLSDLLFDLLWEFPRNLLLSYFWATLFFRGFLALWLTWAVTTPPPLRPLRGLACGCFQRRA